MLAALQTGVNRSIVRIAHDGSIDDQFGANGMAPLPIGQTVAIEQSSSGAIAVAGYSGTGDKVVLYKLTPSGDIDLAFGINGAFSIDIANFPVATSLKLLGDGSVLLGGYTNGPGMNFVIKLNPNGTINESFAEAGWLLLQDHERATSLQTDSAGNIYIGTDRDILKFDDQGTFVAELFSIDNGTIEDIDTLSKLKISDSDQLYAIALGTLANQTNIVRFTSSGDIDTSYGVAGVATYPIESRGSIYSGYSVAVDFELLPSGAGIVAGNSEQNEWHTIQINSQNQNGINDISFGRLWERSSIPSSLSVSSGQKPIAIAPEGEVFDTYLSSSKSSGIGDYGGSTLSISRIGGLEYGDAFLALAPLTFMGDRALLFGQEVAELDRDQRSVSLTFFPGVSQYEINKVVQNIGYHTSAIVQQELHLVWEFSSNIEDFEEGHSSAATASTVVTVGEPLVPYWIAGMLPDQVKQLLEFESPFPVEIPYQFQQENFSSSDQSALPLEDQVYVIAALNYISTLLNITFVEVDDSEAPYLLSFVATNSRSYASYFNPGNILVALDFYESGVYDPTSQRTSLVIIHEIGHALGLKHPGESVSEPPYLYFEDSQQFSRMSYRGESEFMLEFAVLDIAALQYLFGPSKLYGLGDDTYFLDANSYNFIWDSSGVDTIDASQLTKPLFLALKEGLWSFIDHMAGSIVASGQVTINYGTLIENAIGSSYADVLWGNEADNYLNGGDGSDTIGGLGGDDSLLGGSGRDVFIFLALTHGLDNITDFLSDYDVIHIGRGGFSNELPLGELNSSQFVQGMQASEVLQQFIYDQASGSLWFDVDGTGPNEAVEFVTLQPGAQLVASDIYIVEVDLSFDNISPSIAILSDRVALGIGETATINFTLSEPSTNFVLADIQVSGGTLTNFSGFGTSYFANFTPTPNSSHGLVSVPSGAFTDAAGNANADGADPNNTVTMSVNAVTGDTDAPTLSQSLPAADSHGVARDAVLRFSFSESVEIGAGVIVLKTAAGNLVQTFASGSTGLTLAEDTLTLQPTAPLALYGLYEIEFAPNAILDQAGNAFAQPEPLKFRTETLDELYHFFVVAFSGVPGAFYMEQLAGAYNAGMSVQEIVNLFVTKPQFTDLYPTTLSYQQLAGALVEDVVKESASTQAKAMAVNDIVGALDSGFGLGDMVYTVFGNLASLPFDHPVWGDTARQFDNQLTVARYLTEELAYSTTDVGVLRGVIADVGPGTDVSTEQAIIELIGVLP